MEENALREVVKLDRLLKRWNPNVTLQDTRVRLATPTGLAIELLPAKIMLPTAAVIGCPGDGLQVYKQFYVGIFQALVGAELCPSKWADLEE